MNPFAFGLPAYSPIRPPMPMPGLLDPAPAAPTAPPAQPPGLGMGRGRSPWAILAGLGFNPSQAMAMMQAFGGGRMQPFPGMAGFMGGNGRQGGGLLGGGGGGMAGSYGGGTGRTANGNSNSLGGGGLY